jgi:hypothetical protein
LGKSEYLWWRQTKITKDHNDVERATAFFRLYVTDLMTALDSSELQRRAVRTIDSLRMVSDVDMKYDAERLNVSVESLGLRPPLMRLRWLSREDSRDEGGPSSHSPSPDLNQ